MHLATIIFATLYNNSTVDTDPHTMASGGSYTRDVLVVFTVLLLLLITICLLGGSMRFDGPRAEYFTAASAPLVPKITKKATTTPTAPIPIPTPTPGVGASEAETAQKEEFSAKKTTHGKASKPVVEGFDSTSHLYAPA